MDRHVAAESLTPPQFAPTQWARIVATLRLSPQQANIAALILQGRRDKQIAYELGLSPATVRTHLRNTFTRLDLADRVELVLQIFAVAARPSAERAYSISLDQRFRSSCRGIEM